MKLHTYLSFDGQCAEAFRFYERCLGGKIEFMLTHANAPGGEDAAPEWRDRIMHACLVVDDAMLMGADAPPGSNHEPRGFCVSLAIEDPTAAERIFRDLSENGTVQMAMQETFWAIRFGMLTDRFGIPWMVNCARATS